MEYVISNKLILGANRNTKECGSEAMNLTKAMINKEYIIKDVKTSDEELRDFLFTLGCYKDEMVTVLSILGGNYIITVKDARYSIDKDLAEAIVI